MAKAEQLAALRDIHLPETIGWWPLAPGWYILIAGFLGLVMLLAFVLYRHYLKNYAKRQALALLAEYYQNYQKNRNTQETSAQLSTLLRRVALSWYPRAEVAGLQGEAWIAFLDRQVKGLNFDEVKAMLLELPYQSPQSCTLEPLFSKVEAWIKQGRTHV